MPRRKIKSGPQTLGHDKGGRFRARPHRFDKLLVVVAVDHLIALLGSGGTIPRGRYRRVVVTGEGDGGKIAV